MTTPLPANVVTALDNIKHAIDTTNMSTEDRTRVEYAIQDLEPVLADLVNSTVDLGTANIPVFGGLIGNVIKAGIDQTLQQIEQELTAAKVVVA